MAPNHAGLGAKNMWIYYLQRFPSCCGPQQGECSGHGVFKHIFKFITATSSKTSSIQPEIQKYLEHLQSVCLLEHQALSKLRREEAQIGDYDLIGETLMEIDKRSTSWKDPSKLSQYANQLWKRW